jgi:hypothetical protein
LDFFRHVLNFKQPVEIERPGPDVFGIQMNEMHPPNRDAHSLEQHALKGKIVQSLLAH